MKSEIGEIEEKSFKENSDVSIMPNNKEDREEYMKKQKDLSIISKLVHHFNI